MMPRICFVESQTYSVLNPESSIISTGGEAVQHSLLAREFANQGWTVNVVCLDVGQEDGEYLDGITIRKTYRRRAGLPGFRFLYPRVFKLWQALKKADADVYYQSCAGFTTGVVAKFAKRHGRKMIFRVAHDTDCVPGQQLIKTSRDRWLYEYGLRSADLISVQSDVQAKALEKYYALPSVNVKMIVQSPKESLTGERDIDVLWVNNLRAFKRPDIVWDIATQLPNVNIVMIGGRMRGDEKLYQDTESAATKLPNLTFLGAVPYSEVNSYFARAKLFLNTSDSEGFPNSYLQAWIRGVPVVSYFDPDGLIASQRIGAKVATQNDFCEPIERLLRSAEERNESGARARQFANDNYSPAAIVQQYRELFESKFGVDPDND